MKTKHIVSACAIAVLCSSLAGELRALDQTGRTSGYQDTGKVEKINKASGLIGMEVRNQNDEKLGSIQDLVVDVDSGKVSYAVLDAGGVFKDKLFAIPTSAFRPSGDNKYLILHADKSRMENAKGLEKNAWPTPSGFSSHQLDQQEIFWETSPALPATR